MTLLVVGSVAFDTVETPFGRVERALGGSATFFAYAASYFGPQQLIGIVGGDFPPEQIEEFQTRGIDTQGLVVNEEGETFHWTGRYEGDMNEAHTLSVGLNVLDGYQATVPDSYKDTAYLFLANDHPGTQLAVLEAMRGEPFTVADTRDFWISEEPEALKEVISKVNGLVLNEHEAKLLTGEQNLVCCGQKIREMCPGFVVVKKGEHGALLFSDEGISPLPAVPLAEVRDPTGAGDAFAGGLMGHLASSGDTSHKSIKRGMVYGTVTASIAVEDFTVEPFRKYDRSEVERRFEEFSNSLRF